MPYPFSVMTLLTAKKSVARTSGGQEDPEQQEIAGEAIRDTITDLNNIRDWTWLQNTSVAANVSSGSITVPTRMKKIYSVGFPLRPLSYINRRELDRETMPGHPLGGQYFYSAYNTAQAGVISIHDPFTTSSPQNVTINYLTMMDYPPNNSSEFTTVPEQAMAYVLANAKAAYLADKGGDSTRLGFWANKSTQYLRNLIIDNQRVLDEDTGFRPGAFGFIVPTIQEWVTY